MYLCTLTAVVFNILCWIIVSDFACAGVNLWHVPQHAVNWRLSKCCTKCLWTESVIKFPKEKIYFLTNYAVNIDAWILVCLPSVINESLWSSCTFIVTPERTVSTWKLASLLSLPCLLFHCQVTGILELSLLEVELCGFVSCHFYLSALL